MVVRCNNRGEPDSRAFVELDGCRFKRMFVALGASLNGFIMGCRNILFVDGAHLSGRYEGSFSGAVGLDADNHVFDVAYAIVSSENNEDWVWFLSNVRKCLGGLQQLSCLIGTRLYGMQCLRCLASVSYTHLTLPTNREV